MHIASITELKHIVTYENKSIFRILKSSLLSKYFVLLGGSSGFAGSSAGSAGSKIKHNLYSLSEHYAKI